MRNGRRAQQKERKHKGKFKIETFIPHFFLTRWYCKASSSSFIEAKILKTIFILILKFSHVSSQFSVWRKRSEKVHFIAPGTTYNISYPPLWFMLQSSFCNHSSFVACKGKKHQIKIKLQKIFKKDETFGIKIFRFKKILFNTEIL